MPSNGHRFLFVSCWVLLWGTLIVEPRAGFASDSLADRGEAERIFETRVRPVLADRCLNCHGPSQQKSGLRLDSREAVLKGGDLGPAIVPGDPDQSLLINAVAHTDDFLKMPPGPETLPDEVIHDLTDWVRAGAPWPQASPSADSNPSPTTHWAFQPLRKPDPPAEQSADDADNPIDAFLRARLDPLGLTFSPEADRRTLIRRLSFDLTGLPPSPEEIQEFLSDVAPEAYARLVDRLLDSPRYGERWGRHWLDVARYADTKGYVFDQERRYPFAYTYRDYVIRAFNEDKPYNQFIHEQLAADLLPERGDPSDLAALGFLTVGRRFLNKQEDIIDDRIDVTTRGLLGLTVACARCHDHKYDPIPAEDYYSLYGVFASSEEPEELPLLTNHAGDASEAYLAERHKRAAEVRAYLEAKRVEYGDDLMARLAEYLAAAVELDLNAGHPEFDATARKADLRPRLLRRVIMGWASWTGSATSVDDPFLGPWHALAMPADPSEFAKKVSELASSWEAELASGPADSTRVLVLRAVIGDKPPESRVELARRYGTLLSRIVREPENPEIATIREQLAITEGPISLPEDDRELVRFFERDERNKLRELERKLAELDATHPEAPPRAMVMVDKERPYDPYIFLRGNPGRRGAEVPRRFLQILAGPDRQPFQKGSGRLELAQAITSPENPLTARVLVNRIWMHHFGRPLVNTPSDFGFRSDPPTHPELLDWLAATFIEDGWSIKRLHRRIVLSQAYRQQSLDRPECLAVDPENALVWKQNRRRLELEPLRDAMLAAAGQLDLTMGGRSVDVTDAPFSTRRTVYGFIDRQNLPGLFRTFDLASPDTSNPLRYETTVPQQALFLMNSPFVAEQARHVARRLENGTSDSAADRVRALYTCLLGREAEAEEIALGIEFVASRGDGPPEIEPVWRYGYGRFDPESARVSSFAPFPHWVNGSWQFGDKVPHPEFGHLHLKAEGGHVGQDEDHAVILRWVAPCDGVITIEGPLRHPNKEGDGVRGRIVAGAGGLLGEWTAHNGEVTLRVDRHEVTAGDWIDFVVDGRSGPAFDSFRWAPVIRDIEQPPAEGIASSWSARDNFQGPQSPRLAPWEQLAHVLLLTNEFVFID